MRRGNAKEATMATITHRTEMQLAAQEVVGLDDVEGTRLRCVEGSLWITLDRDLRDIVLGPGDSFTVDRGGVTLVHALKPARVSVERGADAAVLLRTGGWRRAVAGLARRLLLPAPPSGLAGA
jgi:hypothetical protein